jgi:ATP-dependent helicase HrpB
MALSPEALSFPAASLIPALKAHFEHELSLIISAPPGAGKSTILPLALLDASWLGTQKILMLEPRRLAARTIAMRMADLLGEEVGNTVGYRVRFESRVSAATRLEVLTEGILTRMLQQDNALEGVAMVVFDEFHERSLHADLALALCRESQTVLRPDLRILIMSATLNLPRLSTLLGAKVLESEGKMFPVSIQYSGGSGDMLLAENAARTTIQALERHDGDALVFLPGEAEIRQCAELLERSLPDFRIHPLYSQLKPQEQLAAILPNRNGMRKVVVATSIAETSLTIEGVRIVIDSGYSRKQQFDSASGLSRLVTVPVSVDAADQRAGRAGRLAPGVCYRLWSLADHARLHAHRTPEILEADLCSLMLELAAWGVRNPADLMWLDLPPATAVKGAQDTLMQLGAIDEKGITPHGKAMQALGCHPRLAHMLLMASDEASQQLACDIAALLEERDPLGKEAGIDLNKRIEQLRRERGRGSVGKRFQRIAKGAESYARLLKIAPGNDVPDPYETGLLLAFAYPERIASSRPGNNARFMLANGKLVMASHNDDLAHEAWLSVAHADLREGQGRIFLAAQLNPKDLRSHVKEREVIDWDIRKGGLVASRDLRIGSIVLQSKPMHQPDPERVRAAIIRAVQTEGKALLDVDASFEQLLLRLRNMAAWNPNEDWPALGLDDWLHANEVWLGGWYEGLKRNEDLYKISLTDALKQHLGWTKVQELDRRAPSKIAVPTGSHIPVQYGLPGNDPILAVRLQELFGMSDTPKLNDGKVPVVLHLLSPGYKPVQVTRDLRSFWNSTYFEVKKELQRRYPKHAWPEDPWKAAPVAKGRSVK